MEPRLKEIIAVVNAKGGVGKTTTVQNIAAGMIHWNMNLRILVIDLDAQRDTSYLMGWDRNEPEGKPTVYDALRQCGQLPVYNATKDDGKVRRGIYYTPSSKFMEIVSSDLYRYMNSKLVLAQIFGKPIQNFTDNADLHSVDDFDYVIIDCPPAMSEVTYNAMGAASSLIIPIQLEGMAYQGLSDLMTVYKDVVNQHLNDNLAIMGILKVMTQDKLNTSKGYSELLGQQFEDYVFQSRIRRSNKINEAQTLRKDIFEYAPKSTVAEDYGNLVSEIIKKQ